MTSRDEYLDQVDRSMRGMDPRVRADILRELAAHIADSTAANGGDVAAAVAALGGPEEVGRRNRELYGFGRRYKALFLIVAMILAIPSVPVLGGGPEGPYPLNLAILFLVATAAWILWVSVAAGARVGLEAGLAGFGARVAAFGLALVLEPQAVVSAGGITAFVAASVLLPVLGWLPGTARKVWSRPTADL